MCWLLSWSPDHTVKYLLSAYSSTGWHHLASAALDHSYYYFSQRMIPQGCTGTLFLSKWNPRGYTWTFPSPYHTRSSRTKSTLASSGLREFEGSVSSKIRPLWLQASLLPPVYLSVASVKPHTTGKGTEWEEMLWVKEDRCRWGQQQRQTHHPWLRH